MNFIHMPMPPEVVLRMDEGDVFVQKDGLVVGTNVMDAVARRLLEEHVRPGMRVRLIRFAPSPALPDGEPGWVGGETGTVTFIDAAGTLGVAWDNGRTLGLVLSDSYEVWEGHLIEEGEVSLAV